MSEASNVVPFKPEALPKDPQALMAAVYNLPLMVLVQRKKEILAHIEAVGGELTPELDDLFDNITDLLEGKIDRVAIFVKEVIPAHIEACKEQVARLNLLEARIKDYTIECIKAQGHDSAGKYPHLNGLAWRARVQANPPSLVIDNADAVPMMFKKGTASIEIKFDPSNAKLRAELEATCKKAVEIYGATYEFSVDPDISAMKEVMTGENSAPIDGAHLEQGMHVRFEAGKAKPSAKAGKKKETT